MRKKTCRSLLEQTYSVGVQAVIAADAMDSTTRLVFRQHSGLFGRRGARYSRGCDFGMLFDSFHDGESREDPRWGHVVGLLGGRVRLWRTLSNLHAWGRDSSGLLKRDKEAPVGKYECQGSVEDWMNEETRGGSSPPGRGSVF